MRITPSGTCEYIEETDFSPLMTLELLSKVLLQRLSSFSGTATAVRTVLKTDERGELLEPDTSAEVGGTLEEAEAMNDDGM